MHVRRDTKEVSYDGMLQHLLQRLLQRNYISL